MELWRPGINESQKGVNTGETGEDLRVSLASQVVALLKLLTQKR